MARNKYYLRVGVFCAQKLCHPEVKRTADVGFKLAHGAGNVAHGKHNGVTLRLGHYLVVFEAFVFRAHFPFIGVALPCIPPISLQECALTI